MVSGGKCFPSCRFTRLKVIEFINLQRSGPFLLLLDPQPEEHLLQLFLREGDVLVG